METLATYIIAAGTFLVVYLGVRVIGADWINNAPR